MKGGGGDWTGGGGEGGKDESRKKLKKGRMRRFIIIYGRPLSRSRPIIPATSRGKTFHYFWEEGLG